MKKNLWKLVGGMAMAAVLSGCSGKGAETPAASSAPAQKTETKAPEETEKQSQSGQDNAEENILVLYTARSEQLNDAIIPGFEAETGIKVEIITGTTGECLKRVQSETANPGGDILWAADETMLASYQDLFIPKAWHLGV